jgi:hypothetical protein
MNTVTLTRAQLVEALNSLRDNQDYINQRMSNVSTKSRLRAQRRAQADVIWAALTATPIPD